MAADGFAGGKQLRIRRSSYGTVVQYQKDSASCAGMSNWEANFQIMFVLVQNFMGSGGVDSMQILYCSSCELILIISIEAFCRVPEM